MYISDEVYEQIKRYIITDEDVYISIAGTIGKAGIIPSELNGANLTENACRLVLNGKVYKRFVYYYTLLNSFKERLKQLTKTGSQPKLAITRLATAEITYPDIEEQKEIVKLLDLIIIKLDKLQSNYEQTITLCNDLKQSILKDIFG
jgi:type I restriction enzyme S subunit